MFDLSSISAILALLFEGIYVVIGIIVLALTAVVAPGRKGLVATGGALLTISAIGDSLVQAWTFYIIQTHVWSAESPFILPNLLGSVCALVFVGGLLVLVLAATKRSTKQAAAAPPPPPPSSRPGAQPFPTR